MYKLTHTHTHTQGSKCTCSTHDHCALSPNEAKQALARITSLGASIRRGAYQGAGNWQAKTGFITKLAQCLICTSSTMYKSRNVNNFFNLYKLYNVQAGFVLHVGMLSRTLAGTHCDRVAQCTSFSGVFCFEQIALDWVGGVADDDGKHDPRTNARIMNDSSVLHAIRNPR